MCPSTRRVLINFDKEIEHGSFLLSINKAPSKLMEFVLPQSARPLSLSQKNRKKKKAKEKGKRNGSREEEVERGRRTLLIYMYVYSDHAPFIVGHEKETHTSVFRKLYTRSLLLCKHRCSKGTLSVSLSLSTCAVRSDRDSITLVERKRVPR